VEAMPENREALDVYMMTRYQYAAFGMGRPGDISIPAVCDVMDRYPGGIENQWECLNKVRRVFHERNQRDTE